MKKRSKLPRTLINQKELAGWIGRTIRREGHPMTVRVVRDILEELEFERTGTALAKAASKINDNNFERFVRIVKKEYKEY